jgi:hypothetical protein
VAFVAGQQGIWMPLIDQRAVLLQARHAGMESAKATAEAEKPVSLVAEIVVLASEKPESAQLLIAFSAV